MSLDWLIAIRILVAGVLGAAIGYQREKAGKPAGLRTHMLICIGAALFTLVSTYGFSGQSDPARVASNIVTGIGFIGAGAIIFRSSDGYVVGLTTASTIWIAAGVGMAVGSGLYIAALITCAIALIVLFIPHLK
jgi:putative Mg2+ transporter-C (MgtC) family protein